MAPAPGLDHQDVVGELYFQIRRQLANDGRRVYDAPVEVLLPKAGEDDADVEISRARSAEVRQAVEPERPKV